MLDYILVGAGVAGLSLAFHLKKTKSKFVVIDDNQKTCSSIVAAGVLNPITGQRLVKSWKSEVAMPYAREFYPELENILGKKIFHSGRILQVCKSLEESELWHFRKDDQLYCPFLNGTLNANSLECINDSFGSFFIDKVAHIDTETFCKCAKDFFIENNLYRSETFDFSKLKVLDDHIQYGEISAKGIIFCEGYKAIENPFFNWLPFSPAKGEILVFSSDAKLPPEIIHKEKWIMRIDENTFRCGSTWDRINLNQETSQEAQLEITKAIERILKNFSSLKVISKAAGVRPCTRTTRPFLGTHPKYKNVHIFNGFGSKGYALSPYFANEFVKYLEGKTQLDKEANIARHLKKFYKEQ